MKSTALSVPETITLVDIIYISPQQKWTEKKLHSDYVSIIVVWVPAIQDKSVIDIIITLFVAMGHWCLFILFQVFKLCIPTAMYF